MGVERGGGGGWKKGGNLIQRRSKLPRHRRLITLKFDNERAIKMILMKNPVTQDQTRHFSPPPPPLLNSIKPHVTQKNMKKKTRGATPPIAEINPAALVTQAILASRIEFREPQKRDLTFQIFLFFWLLFNEKLRERSCRSCRSFQIRIFTSVCVCVVLFLFRTSRDQPLKFNSTTIKKSDHD